MITKQKDFMGIFDALQNLGFVPLNVDEIVVGGGGGGGSQLPLGIKFVPQIAWYKNN